MIEQAIIFDEDYTPQDAERHNAPPLFDRHCIAIATFLGSTLAGGVLMYLNAHRLGSGKGVQHLAVATVVVVVTIGITLLLPDGTPGLLLTFVQLGILLWYFSQQQEPSIVEHVAHGGRIVSRWSAAGIGLIGAVVVLGLGFLLITLGDSMV